jgi:hypothetical protein
VRVRVCGKAGRAYFHITETSSPPGQNSPVWERTRRRRDRPQDFRCQTHRFTWVMADKFFGVSRYRVGVRARTTDREWSALRARHVDTYD